MYTEILKFSERKIIQEVILHRRFIDIHEFFSYLELFRDEKNCNVFAAICDWLIAAASSADWPVKTKEEPS